MDLEVLARPHGPGVAVRGAAVAVGTAAVLLLVSWLHGGASEPSAPWTPGALPGSAGWREPVSVLLGSLAEEAAFRALLPLVVLVLLRRRTGSAAVAVAVSVLAGATSHWPTTMIAYADHLLFGLLMFDVLSRTRSLVVPVALHVWHDLVVGVLPDGDVGTGTLTGLVLVLGKYAVLFPLVAWAFHARSWPAWLRERPAGAAARQSPSAPRDATVDAARGIALLLIMIENVLLYLPAESFVSPTSGTDRAIRAGIAVLVEYRGLPLFALLLGFSTFALLGRGPTGGGATRRAGRRRSSAFLVLGAVHGLFVCAGDVLAVYGVLLLALVWCTRLQRRRLDVVTGLAAVALVLQTFLLPLVLTGSSAGDTYVSSFSTAEWSVAAALRPLEWSIFVATAPLLTSGLLFPMLLGYRTGRLVFQVAPAPVAGHLRRAAAVLGVSSVALSVPYAQRLLAGWGDPAVVHGQVWPLVASQLGGLLGALAIWLGVLALRQDRLRAAVPPRTWACTAAVAAAGRWTLSLYLLHSATLLVLLPPSGLDLGRSWQLAGHLALAVGTWVVVTWWCSRARSTVGPAERLVRDLASDSGGVDDRDGLGSGATPPGPGRRGRRGLAEDAVAQMAGSDD